MSIKLAIAAVILAVLVIMGGVIRWQHQRLEAKAREIALIQVERDQWQANASEQEAARKEAERRHADDMARVQAAAATAQRVRDRAARINQEIVRAPEPPPSCPATGPAVAAALRGLRGIPASAGENGNGSATPAGSPPRLPTPAGPARP